jgi:hypothetical protein
MTTTPGWEPRPGPARGEPSRQTPRGGTGGWPAGDPRRQAGRDGAPAGRPRGGPGAGGQDGDRGPRDRASGGGPGWDGRDDRNPGPSFTPDRRTPSGSPNGYQRRRPPGSGGGGGFDGLEGLRGSPLLRWVGAMPVKVAVLVLAIATVLGIVFTLVAGHDPGFLIGLFITIGAAIATLGVRRGGVYLFFPLPALAAFVAAVLTGKIHDSQLASSTAGTAAGFLQWIAGVFYPMCAATIVVLLVGGARWLLSRQLVSGQFTMSAGRPGFGARPSPGGGRPGTDDSWSDADMIANRPDRPGQDRPRPDRAPWLGQNGARSARPQRPDRDPWGDPRPAADRNQPGAPPRPGPDTRGGRPAGPGQPRRPQPRDPRDPRPPRPQPRQPRDPWDNG